MQLRVFFCSGIWGRSSSCCCGCGSIGTELVGRGLGLCGVDGRLGVIGRLCVCVCVCVCGVYACVCVCVNGWVLDGNLAFMIVRGF